MKSIIFNLITFASLFFVSAQNQSYADDCAVLKRLYQAWQQPTLATWPDEIGACCDDVSIVCDPHHGEKRIAELKLRSRNFRGPIPEEITKLKYLNYLSLADNYLNGEIPQNIDELLYLAKFSFRNNQLTGNIPDAVGNIDGIFHLDFAGNQLSGKIPETFGNLKQLQFLNLSCNNLEGYIPENFKGLKKLTTFQLQGNNFQGYVPLVESIGNCTYENTNLCYQEGASCTSTAHKCSQEEIDETRKNNGYATYSENDSSSSSSSGCKCGSSSSSSNSTSDGFFSGWVSKAVIGAIVLAVIGIIVYCIFGGKEKDDMNAPPNRANYINYY